MKFEWVGVDDWTWIAKVIGGWVLKSMFNDNDGNSVVMVFIPDPEHLWEVETD